MLQQCEIACVDSHELRAFANLSLTGQILPTFLLVSNYGYTPKGEWSMKQPHKQKQI